MIRFPFFRFPYRYYNNSYFNYAPSSPSWRGMAPVSQTRENASLTPVAFSNKTDFPVNTNPKEYEEKKENRNVYSNQSNKEQKNFNKNKTGYQKGPVIFHFDHLSSLEDPVLEVFGIQLFLDDIIILGLIFLLYKEEVKDEMLFISLFLLLLS